MELEQRVTDNKAILDRLVPVVERHEKTISLHEKIIFGDKTDRKDEGLVGTMNNIEEFILSAKGWIKWASMTVIGAAIMGIIKLILDTAILLQTQP